VLEAVRVTKRFADVTALRGVDFLLEPGQVHALAGRKGAGKSVLVKVLTGVLQPDRGMLFHKGAPVRFTGPADALGRGISTLYQDVNLIGSLSVSANLFLGREPRNRLGMLSFRQMNLAAAGLLDSLGISVDPRRELGALTPGAQQMIAIARAVTTNARIVVMDEPAAVLGPAETDTLSAIIGMLREQGVAVIYISRHLRDLYRICDRVTVLRDGEVVHTGPMSATSPFDLALAQAQ
jgi:galactofuranose transport system ATP-binding protein